MPYVSKDTARYVSDLLGIHFLPIMPVNDVPVAKLTDLERSTLAMHLWNDEDCDLYPLTNSDDFEDFANSMRRMMSARRFGNDLEFCEKIRRILIKNYQLRMQEVLDDACSEARSASWHEKGYSQVQDRNTGETRWTHL